MEIYSKCLLESAAYIFFRNILFREFDGLPGFRGDMAEIHKLGSASRLKECLVKAHKTMESRCVQMTNFIVSRNLGKRGLMFIGKTLNLRFITPRSFNDNADTSLSWQFNGHPVHIDSIYNVALNNKNIWIPFTDLDPENTLLIHTKKERVKLLGPAGKAHIFDSDFPHETIQNNTDKTRITLTLRYCESWPRFRHERGIKYSPCLL